MRWIAIFWVAVALAGCASQESMLRKHALETEPDLMVRQLIWEKKIKAGMTKDQVIASWGYPCGYCYGTRRSSWGDTWEYSVFGSSSMGRGKYLFFDQSGVLTHWSD